MTMHHTSPLGKVRLAVLICCFALIIGVFGYAYVSGNRDVVTRDEISAKMDSLENQDLGYTYTSAYLKKFGIGNIDSLKINEIETIVETAFYKPLPEKHVLARSIGTLFLEHFYDEIDLESRTDVTDAVLKCYFASLGDPYAYYRTVDEFYEYIGSLGGNDSTVGIGVLINATTLEVISVYNDSPAEKAGIKRGDFIIAVNGHTLETHTADELATLIKGEDGTSVSITVKRNGEEITVTAIRGLVKAQSVTYEILEDEKLGYIYITQFLETTADQFKNAIDKCTEANVKGLVIDVRDNPGGLLDIVVDVIDYIVPDESGRMIACYTAMGERTVYTTQDGHSVDVPIAVICNGGTASAGELFTAAMRDFNDMDVIDAIIVGDVTYGKGVVQNSYQMTDYSGITFTIGYYNPPCDINFDGEGITPDFLADDELTGSDYPYTVALEELKKILQPNGETIALLPLAA